MEAQIVKTALLGTDKFCPEYEKDNWPLNSRLKEQEPNREALFLKQVAVYLFYQEGGQALARESLAFMAPPPESQPVMPNAWAGPLRSALMTKDEQVMDYLFFHLRAYQYVLPPVLVPTVLSLALNAKKKAPLYFSACGVVGRWLAQMNEAWQPLLAMATQGDTEDWETRSLEHRVAHFQKWRNTDARAARDKLEKMLREERAEARQALIQVVEVALSPDDVPLLETYIKDKSKKVATEAWRLLKQIPGTTYQEYFTDYLQKAILLKPKQKGLIFNDKVSPERFLFDGGMEKISGTKGLDDHIFWIGQALASSPPGLVAHHLGISEIQFLELLMASSQKKHLRPFLIEAARVFKMQSWALALGRDYDEQDPALLDLLTPEDRTDLLIKWAKTGIQNVVAYVLQFPYETISLKLTQAILEQMAREPYRVQLSEARALAFYFPKAARGLVEQFMHSHQEQEKHLPHFLNHLNGMLDVLHLKEIIHA